MLNLDLLIELIFPFLLCSIGCFIREVGINNTTNTNKGRTNIRRAFAAVLISTFFVNWLSDYIIESIGDKGYMVCAILFGLFGYQILDFIIKLDINRVLRAIAVVIGGKVSDTIKELVPDGNNNESVKGGVTSDGDGETCSEEKT